jgi:CBS domain containing-hemolysin-like protein
MSIYVLDSINIILAGIFVLLNGFFVAAEFAIVKVRASRLEELKEQHKPFANTAIWLFKRQNLSLSVCQLGITMASLALGWIGEPALAHLMKPAFLAIGMASEVVLHAIAFTVAFSIITSLHIVIGEQVPKIYAIRRPGIVFLWCAGPLKVFYIVFYPFMILLNNASIFFLRKAGIDNPDAHDTPLSEAEIRASLSSAHFTGELSGSEHRLLNAVFKFDDMVCRQIMVPRGEVEFLDIDRPYPELLGFARKSHHTRLPLCKGSLDNVIGIIHLKNLVGIFSDEPFDLNKIAHKPLYVPEGMPLSHLLTHFQTIRQHMVFVVDEHGTIVGIVTLEDVLEQLVGEVQDEFDAELPNIVPDGQGQFIVLGGTLIEELNDELDLNLHSEEMDTLSGLLIEHVGQMLSPGKRVELASGIKAEVMELKGNRATRVRLTIPISLNKDTSDKTGTDKAI